MGAHSEKLPAVLIPPIPLSGISMERALKQIKRLLEEIEPRDASHEDAVNASIDDASVMLLCIDWG